MRTMSCITSEQHLGQTDNFVPMLTEGGHGLQQEDHTLQRQEHGSILHGHTTLQQAVKCILMDLPLEACLEGESWQQTTQP